MSEPGTSVGSRIFEAIRGGTAPQKARLAAARGSLPLARSELVALQLVLLEDDDQQIREVAAAYLAELLVAVDLDTEIPVEAFIAVAEILRYVYAANGTAPPEIPEP